MPYLRRLLHLHPTLLADVVLSALSLLAVAAVVFLAVDLVRG